MNPVLRQLRDYEFYCKRFLRIKTKLDGVRPLILRTYQRKFIEFCRAIKGPKRVNVVKPRQCGLSTLVASIFSHLMYTGRLFKVLAMADQSERAKAIGDIYMTFLKELPVSVEHKGETIGIRPRIGRANTEQITFENLNVKMAKKDPGLMSGVSFATALDPNAGKSEPRNAAHLSEVAFYRYWKEIEESVQNSIPLHHSTWVIRESTANGRAGIGGPFFQACMAARRGDSIYKLFFVAWYEVDDYAITPPHDFKATKAELDILKQHPSVTEANLVWRRLKTMEYLNDEEETILSPEERVNQDFPYSVDEAFLHSGQPVVDFNVINKIIKSLTDNKINDLKDKLDIQSYILKNNWNGLQIFSPPRDGKKYYIGLDVSEGLAVGDASTACVIDENYTQVACYWGKIEPDMLGHLAVALGDLYYKALLVPECNAMGHSTVTEIKRTGYINLFKKVTEDKITKIKATTYGWRTTAPSKNDMLNEIIKQLRDKVATILDLKLAIELSNLTREENGRVNLNGRDRTVAFGLALMGRRQYPPNHSSRQKKLNSEIYDTVYGKKKKRKSMFG